MNHYPLKTFTAEELLSRNLALTFDDVSLVPEYSEIISREDVDISTNLVADEKISIPIVPTNMDTITENEMMLMANDYGTVGFLHRFMNFDHFSDCLKLYSKTPYNEPMNHADVKFVGISIGLDVDEYTKWVETAIYHTKLWHRPLVVMVDIANGYSSNIEPAIANLKLLRSKYKELYIIAGNVCESSGAKYLCDLGVDGIRVGIGNGSACSTRIRTGVGIPQLTAIIDCRIGISEWHAENLSKKRPTLLCDGGIKTPGDIAKALAAGADSCLSGYLFKGTSKTPGEVIRIGEFPNYKYYKQYRGSASMEVKKKVRKEGFVEGNSVLVDHITPTNIIFEEVKEGLQSAFSYLGATDVIEFRSNARFVLVTPSGNYEGLPNAMFK